MSAVRIIKVLNGLGLIGLSRAEYAKIVSPPPDGDTARDSSAPAPSPSQQRYSLFSDASVSDEMVSVIQQRVAKTLRRSVKRGDRSAPADPDAEQVAIAVAPPPAGGGSALDGDDDDDRQRSDRALDAYRVREEVRARLDAMDDVDLWRLFQSEPCEDKRNYLIEKYYPLVRSNAERVYTRLPDEVDIEDLVSAGLFGLMDAINAFDLERGVKFETYCAQRIRGAILDELRSMDWVPRLVRHRTSRVEQTKERLRMSLGRTPTEEEVSGALGVDEEEVKKILRDGSAVSTTSLNRQRYQSDGNREVREIDVLEDGTQIDPLSEIQRRDLKSLLTKGLSRAERLIVILYYYEQMTMKQIGATLDLSESRVSQMHSSILPRLKAHLQQRERDFRGDAPSAGTGS